MGLLNRLVRLLTAIGMVAFSTGLALAQNLDFQAVTGPCRLSFPTDHGPHPGYRTEWWYYTGNLTAAGDRRFGFQLTFFRSRLQPPADRRDWPDPTSAWRTDQIYLAHAAVTDIDAGRHRQAEKMSRPVFSLAGAEKTEAGQRIFIHDWQTIIGSDGHHLQAAADAFALRLTLHPVKPIVLHGQDGYSLKGQTPERASCYYSFTRLQAAGSLTVDGRDYPVQGSAWMDHEFSTAPLQPGITGWDWFSLQLSDQTELMIFLLRQGSDGLNPASSGTYVGPSGETRHLTHTDFHIAPLLFWTSPHTGARYPVKWEVRIDSLQLTLRVTANLNDQEMRTPHSTNVVYWEGSVRAQGTRDRQTIDGLGYVELTGYDAPFDAPL